MTVSPANNYNPETIIIMSYKTNQMKRSKRTGWLRLLTVGLVPLLAIALISCDLGDFGDMNENPTQSTELDDRFLLTTVQKGYSGQRGWISRVNIIYGANMVQHTTGGTGTGDIYSLNRSFAEDLWVKMYSSGWEATVRNVQDMLYTLREKQEAGENVDNRMGVARILRAFTFQRLTDVYGDTPYFEAGLGFHEGIFTPRYDPQQDIYDDLFSELEQAVNQIGAPTENDYGAADLLFEGNLDQWRRFGNSVRLRLAMRLVKVDPDRAQAEAQAAINHPAGVMQSNDDMWIFPHEEGPNLHAHTNANAEHYVVNDNYWLSQFFVDWMQQYDDPRLTIFGAVVNPDGSINEVPAAQIGRPSGWSAGELESHPRFPGDVEAYTRIHPRFKTLTAPSIWFSYAEVEFMLAEAEVRWGISPLSAEEHYNRGVEAAMTMLSTYGGDTDISQSEIEDYLANNPFNLTGSEEQQIEQINEQYWAATWQNGVEAWINYRRTGYPAIELAPVDNPDPHPASDTGGMIPSRMTVPEDEALLNASNFEEMMNRQGPNTLTTRMWWDVE